MCLSITIIMVARVNATIYLPMASSYYGEICIKLRGFKEPQKYFVTLREFYLSVNIG